MASSSLTLLVATPDSDNDENNNSNHSSSCSLAPALLEQQEQQARRNIASLQDDLEALRESSDRDYEIAILLAAADRRALQEQLEDSKRENQKLRTITQLQQEHIDMLTTSLVQRILQNPQEHGQEKSQAQQGPSQHQQQALVEQEQGNEKTKGEYTTSIGSSTTNMDPAEEESSFSIIHDLSVLLHNKFPTNNSTTTKTHQRTTSSASNTVATEEDDLQTLNTWDVDDYQQYEQEEDGHHQLLENLSIEHVVIELQQEAAQKKKWGTIRMLPHLFTSKLQEQDFAEPPTLATSPSSVKDDDSLNALFGDWKRKQQHVEAHPFE